MRIVDKEEATGWLSSRGITDSEGRIVEEAFPRKASISIDKDSGRKVLDAKGLVYQFAKFAEWMLFIDGFGLCPDLENWDLFNVYRRSLGETRSLSESPGHLFSSDENDVASSLLAMVLLFPWDAIWASSSGEVVVRILHDERADVYGREGEESDEDPFTVISKW